MDGSGFVQWLERNELANNVSTYVLIPYYEHETELISTSFVEFKWGHHNQGAAQPISPFSTGDPVGRTARWPVLSLARCMGTRDEICM